MKILLIQPHMSRPERKLKGFMDKINSKLFFSPFTLEQLAGIIPEEHEIKIVDERIGQRINYNDEYDLVGISAFTPCINRGYEIADEFRKRSTPVVIGGYHPSALPEEAKQFCDSVVVGESEYLWPMILNDVKNRALKPYYIQDRPVNPEDIPSFRSDQTRGSYFVAGIQATRGCPNHCEFCAISNMKFRSVFRKRPINKVIDEIKSVRQKILHMYDPSLTIDIDYTKTLFKEMKGLNKKFTGNANISIISKHDELLKLASEAGCSTWFIGFESFNQKNLELVGKKSQKVKDYKNAVRKIRDYGINVFGLFMFGLDNDTVDVFDSTLNAVLYDLELTTANFYIYTPCPGTPLYDRLENEGRIITKDWSHYQMDEVVIQPKNMTPEQLLVGFQRVKKEIHSVINVFKHPKDLYFHLFYV